MARKLMMNNVVNGNKKIECEIDTDGSGKIIDVDTYEITDTSSWDYILLGIGGNTNLIINEKYVLNIMILERNLTGNYALDMPSSWSVTHWEYIPSIPNVSVLNLNQLYQFTFTCYAANLNDKINGYQFNAANTGSYLKFKMWIEKA